VDGHLSARVLKQVRTTGDDVRLAEALMARGHARMFRGEPVAAQRHFEELVEIARRIRDETMLATGLIGLGSTALGRGDYGSAEVNLRGGVALAVRSRQTHTELVGVARLAELARLRGDHEHARLRFEECLDRARLLGAPYPLAEALLGLARVLLDDRRARAAQVLFEEVARVARRGRLHHLAAALEGSAEVMGELNDAASARALLEDALAVARQHGDRGGGARSTYHLAVLARGDGDLERATLLHQEGLRQRHQIGDRAGVLDSLEALAGLAPEFRSS
jgi:tetratricopeptide (TPR) repeat protein